MRVVDLEFDGDATVEFKLVLPSLQKTQMALSIPDNYPEEELTLLTFGTTLPIRLNAIASRTDMGMCKGKSSTPRRTCS